MLLFASGSVNPRITDEIFAFFYPSGVEMFFYGLAVHAVIVLLYFIARAIIEVSSDISLPETFSSELKFYIGMIFASLVVFPLQIIMILYLMWKIGGLCMQTVRNRSLLKAYHSLNQPDETNAKSTRRFFMKIGYWMQIGLAGLFGLVIFLLLTIVFPVGGFILEYFGISLGLVISIFTMLFWTLLGINALIKRNRGKSLKQTIKNLNSKPVKIASIVFFVAMIVSSGGIFFYSGLIKPHAAAPSAPTGSSTTNLTILTYNIRNGLANDGDDRWELRKDDFTEYVAGLDADVIGLQEAYEFQIEYIVENLDNRNYAWTGFGRDDGIHGGEHTPILYDADKFEFIDGDTFWFNDYPNIPGNGFRDTYNCRRCTSWVRLRNKVNNAQFMVFCTHYGFGDEFRSKAGPLLVEKIAEYSGGLPVFCMGDFNLNSTQFGFDLVNGTGSRPLTDSYSLANGPGPHLVDTFNSFEIGYEYRKNKIDFIFVTEEITVSSSEVLQDTYEYNGNPHYYSDHFPVISSVTF